MEVEFMGATPILWIVHREPQRRAALARLAALPDGMPQGSPGDALFREAPTPDAVVLGLAGDLERELEFAHRVGPATRAARWILVGDADQLARARTLFDLLPATYLLDPPEMHALRDAIRSAAEGGGDLPLALSQRGVRDRVSERFARCLADLDLPVLLRAIDPRLAEIPLLILGEPGTGRSTLARYVHHFGGTAGGALVEVPCTGQTAPETLLAAAARANPLTGAERSVTLWLADPGTLPGETQHILGEWLRFGLPPGTVRSRSLRWIATDTGTRLDPGLHRNLAGLSVRLPALREQPARIPHLVVATARSWCQARRVPARRFDDLAISLLEEYPWPGNLDELEAVVEQSLAGSVADPLGCADLVLDGLALDPDAGESGGERAGAMPETASPSEAEIVELLAEAVPEPEPLERIPDVPAEAEPLEQTPDVPVEAEFLEQTSDVPVEENAASPGEAADTGLGRLTAAFGQELRSNLPLMRSFASLLSDRHDDPEFRRSFEQLVLANAERSVEFAARLEALGALGPPEPQPVDVAALLQGALEQRRPRIRARRLVVLEELDRREPEARCDPQQLALALETVLDEVIDRIPESGDVYLASRRDETGLRGNACVRVLVRYRGPRASSRDAATEPVANALGFAIADLLVRAQSGAMTVDSGERGETLLLLDLPA